MLTHDVASAVLAIPAQIGLFLPRLLYL